MRRRAILGTAFITLAVALLVGVGVGAAAPAVGGSSTTVVVNSEGQCSASLPSSFAEPGDDMQISVTGLGPGESVTLDDSVMLGGPPPVYTADSSGNLVVDLGFLPDEFAARDVTFTFTGVSTGNTCSATLTVGAIGSDTPVPYTVPTNPTEPPVQQVTTPTAAVEAAGAVSMTPTFTG